MINFGEAMNRLKEGYRVRCKIWNEREYIVRKSQITGEVLDETGEAVRDFCVFDYMDLNWEVLR